MARILAVFDIAPLKDAEGNPVTPNVKFVTEITRYVKLWRRFIIAKQFQPVAMSNLSSAISSQEMRRLGFS